MDNRTLFDNYIPYEISFETSPISVKWIQSQNLQLNAPFFEQSIEDVKKASKDGRVILSNLDQLLQFSASEWSGQMFSGFIFHTSRCGSTVISNCIKTLDKCYVFSEPQPFSAVMLPYKSGIWDFQEEQFNKTRSNLFVALENIYMNFILRKCPGANAFIKFCSWNIVSAEWLKGMRPQTPAVVNYRNPIEIIVSQLKKGGTGILAAKSRPQIAAAMTGLDYLKIPTFTTIEYLSLALNSQYCMAANLLDDVKTMGLDYKQITIENIFRILNLFGLDAKGEGTKERILKQLTTYSKDLLNKDPYEDDSIQKQNEASSEIAVQCLTKCIPSYNQLLFVSQVQSRVFTSMPNGDSIN